MEGLLCIKDLKLNGLLGTCGGDSGSPVVEVASSSHGLSRYEQIGIVSGGMCGSGNPSVLTHINHPKVIKFIDEKIYKQCNTTSESGSPKKNADCQFPFIYDDVTYDTCKAVSLTDNRLWCATQLDDTGSSIDG